MKKLATLVAVGMAVNGWAGGATGAAFLKINPSVRGEALGGVNPAGTSGIQGAGVNPASLSDLGAKYEFTSGFATMVGESQYGTAGFGMKRGEQSAVGLQATYLQSGSLQGRNGTGTVTRDFSARDMAAGITLASVIGGGIRGGVTAKGVRQEIGDLKSGTALAWDLGLGMNLGGIEWGASALNLGGGIEFNGVKEDLPAAYNLGAAVPLGGGLTGLGGVSVRDGETTASLGAEYRLGSISLRLGYRSGGGEGFAAKGQKAGAQALGGMTGGIGFGVRDVRIDYAVSQTAVEYGMSHRAAVTFKWGAETGDREVEVERRKIKAKKKTSAVPAGKSGVTTGSRRAYDPAPIRKAPRKKKVWVN